MDQQNAQQWFIFDGGLGSFQNRKSSQNSEDSKTSDRTAKSKNSANGKTPKTPFTEGSNSMGNVGLEKAKLLNSYIGLFILIIYPFLQIVAGWIPNPLFIKQNVENQHLYQHPEAERLIKIIKGYLELIDNSCDRSVVEHLLDIVFENLYKAININPDDGEINYLFGEALLLVGDNEKALSYFSTALHNQYFYKSEIYYGYGLAYESQGDYFMANNDYPSAIIHYNLSISSLNEAINSNLFLYHNIDNVEKKLIQVEKKIATYNDIIELSKSNSSVYNDSIISDSISMMELVAVNYANSELLKVSAGCYYWLFIQDTADKRRLRILDDFQYVSNIWEFIYGLKCDISNNLVYGVINNDYVHLQQEPTNNNNTISQLKKHEEVKILLQSDFREFGNVGPYWYKISTGDGTVGWVYGKDLCFYPKFTF
jgi:tetratricopeptide (TPR) repeat protein